MLGGFQERQRGSKSRVPHVCGVHVFRIGLKEVSGGTPGSPSFLRAFPGGTSPAVLVALQCQCPGTVSLGSLAGSSRAAVTLLSHLPSALSSPCASLSLYCLSRSLPRMAGLWAAGS